MKGFFSLGKRGSPSRAGSVLIMTALGMMVFIGLIAVVTDLSWMYVQKNRLTTAVNAAWKAGFDEIKWIATENKKQFSAVQGGQDQVRAKVREVIQKNGFSPDEVQITFGSGDALTVKSTQPVGLFFARAIGIETSQVAALRGDSGSSGAGVVPLAIPHGVTKDLSKSVFSVTFFDEDEGFATGTEYILKLGSGGGAGKPDPDPETAETPKMILVPMDAGAQDSDMDYQRAYGAVFWCLKIDAADPGYTPVYWLLGYRGGSFFLPFYDAVKAKLDDYGVNYQVIEGTDAINAIFEAVNPNTLELIDRPRMAIYSSKITTNPVEQIFQDARIPYGYYSQPPALDNRGWTRGAAYTSANNQHFYDTEVENGELANYTWVHMHDEDFTGFSRGCRYYSDGCKEFYDAGRLGAVNNDAGRLAAESRMCAYCQSHYWPEQVGVGQNITHEAGSWDPFPTYDPHPVGDDTPNCLNARRRCTEKRTAGGIWWQYIPGFTGLTGVNIGKNIICNDGVSPGTHCGEFLALQTVADARGYTTDAGATPRPWFYIAADGSRPIDDTQTGWFDLTTSVQKLKWDVAKKIRGHVASGGFVFAEGLAPESLDVALWQAGINSGMTPANAYDECMAFTDFHYKVYPWVSATDTYFTSINGHRLDANQPFTLNPAYNLEVRCQDHAGAPDTSFGTTSFLSNTIKPGTLLFGSDNTDPNKVKYLGGSLGLGKFSFLAASNLNNVQAKRLVLNNILLGSLVSKLLPTDIAEASTGKQKNSFGIIDPDNINGFSDYVDRLQYGFDAPIQISDRIITQSGNEAAGDNAVEWRIENNRRFVIVPITDIPPEVYANNEAASGATSIYDLTGMSQSDNPGGTYASSSYEWTNAIRVIGFAEFEILDPSEYTRDGANISAGDAGDLGNYQSGQIRGRFVRYIVKPGEMPYD